MFWLLPCKLQLEVQLCRKLKNQWAWFALLCLWPVCVCFGSRCTLPRCVSFFLVMLLPSVLLTAQKLIFCQTLIREAQRTQVQTYSEALLVSPWNCTEVSSLFTSPLSCHPKILEVTTPSSPPSSPSSSECRYSRSALRDHFGFGPFFLLTATLVSYHPSVLYLDCVARIIQEILMFVVVCCLRNSSSRNSV